RSVSTLTPAFCPRTNRAAKSRPFCERSFSLSTEAPNEADADDVDIVFAAGILASDILVALPFGPNARFASHIALRTEAKRQIGVSVRGAQSRQGRACFGLCMVGAKFCVNGKPIGKGVSAKADELRSA